jgi:hypothetical protein
MVCIDRIADFGRSQGCELLTRLMCRKAHMNSRCKARETYKRKIWDRDGPITDKVGALMVDDFHEGKADIAQAFENVR